MSGNSSSQYSFNPALLLLVFIAAFLAITPLLWYKVSQLQTRVAALETVVKTAQTAAAPVDNSPKSVKATPLGPTDHILLGTKDAQVLVIEYSDTECPFCKAFHTTLHEVLPTYGNKVAWVYRYFPLSFHQNAEKEAEALQCVSEQGGDSAFLKYVDAVFTRTTSNGQGFSLDQLAPLAKEQGLNPDTFTTCLNSGKNAARVTSDEKTGSNSGVDGTPGTLLVKKDGSATLVSGAVSSDSLKQAIDAALK